MRIETEHPPRARPSRIYRLLDWGARVSLVTSIALCRLIERMIMSETRITSMRHWDCTVADCRAYRPRKCIERKSVQTLQRLLVPCTDARLSRFLLPEDYKSWEQADGHRRDVSTSSSCDLSRAVHHPEWGPARSRSERIQELTEDTFLRGPFRPSF